MSFSSARTQPIARARQGRASLLIRKRIFGFAKVRYRGIAKNAERMYVACALVNLYQLRRALLRLAT